MATGDLYVQKLLDQHGVARDLFYSEFLAKSGLRYFISAVLEQRPDRFAVPSRFSVQPGRVMPAGVNLH
jgi:hypothetical protein